MISLIQAARLAIRQASILMILAVIAIPSGAVPPGTEDEIRARLAPVGEVCRVGDDCVGLVTATTGSTASTAAAASGPRSGEEVYNAACFICHTTGVGGAPLLGDAAAWAERTDKGADALWATMQNGLGAMPAMGTCMDCSDDELRAGMDYLVNSGQ
jgi:cytochrome c5